MRKQHFWTLTVAVITLLVLGSYAYADDTAQFDKMIKSMHAQRAQMELKLGLDPNADPFPQATCYYDDLEDHYAQDQLKFDYIGASIGYIRR